MKRAHLLRVADPVAAFLPLAEILAARGDRLGWLEWRPEDASPAVAGDLAEAARLPALRAVAVGRDGSVVIKPRRGPARLEDIVRESFRGCLVVLVRCEKASLPSLPSLRSSAEAFEIESLNRRWSLSAEALADRLRRPRPFESPPAQTFKKKKITTPVTDT